MEKIIAVAGGILDAAIAILTFAKKFFEKNTPEAALMGALLAAYAGYQSESLPLGAALLGAFTAFMTFMITESAKDAKIASSAVADSAAPQSVVTKAAADNA